MRFFALIFNVYILLLSCTPCADRAELYPDKHAAVSSSQEKQSPQHEDEDCSPFCICSCCGQPTFFMSTITADKQPVVFSDGEKISPSSQSILSANTGDVFQPPKLSMNS